MMDTRSFWGWGHADRFPDRETRRQLADRLEAEVGFPPLSVRDPPTLAECALPDSSIAVPEFLESCCTTDREARIRHTYGKSYPDLVRGFEGQFGPAPDIVAHPPDAETIADILSWATAESVAVVPFGGGTSVVGGIEGDLVGRGALDATTSDGGGHPSPTVGDSYAGVLSLSLRELDSVLAVDEHSRRARIQAGMVGPEINDALAAYGLQLRHYPQSYEFSTLGGWIATRAGGHFATRYTHIDDFVESVRAVTPAGTLETLDVPASGAGPDPNRFLLGSEGAFGVITDAWVRVQPRPQHRAKAAVRFPDFFDGVAATRDIVQARLAPANCRLLDPTEAMINEVATDGSAVLVLGFESIDHPVVPDLDRALDICRSHGGSPGDRAVEGPGAGADGAADGRDGGDRDGNGGDGGGRDGNGGDGGDRDGNGRDGGDRDRNGGDGGGRDGNRSEPSDDAGDWRSSFFEGPYLFNQLVSIGVLADTFETAVTWDRFPDLHAALKREVLGTLSETCGTGVLSCRFTHVYQDGPAPYYTVLAPAERGAELEQWREVKRTASDVLADHDATITHHHAVGRVHRDWYARETPEPYLDALRSMKRTLDPAGIMNPGALLPPAED